MEHIFESYWEKNREISRKLLKIVRFQHPINFHMEEGDMIKNRESPAQIGWVGNPRPRGEGVHAPLGEKY